jgi:hypothetical protein
VAEELRRRNDELTRYFWHGVGRSSYFAYEYLPPCCDLIIDQAAADAASEVERSNFVAGLAWAVTLVNLRNPDLIDFVFHRHRLQPEYIAPLANGVVSSLLVAHDTAPAVEFMDSFCDYHWSTGEWPYRREVLQDPCSLVATLNRMGIRDRIRMGDLYQFRDVDWFFGRVSREP